MSMLENDEIVLLPSKFFYMNEYYDGRFGHDVDDSDISFYYRGRYQNNPEIKDLGLFS